MVAHPSPVSSRSALLYLHHCALVWAAVESGSAIMSICPILFEADHTGLVRDMFCLTLLTQACTSLSQDVHCDVTDTAHVAQNAVYMFLKLHACLPQAFKIHTFIKALTS